MEKKNALTGRILNLPDVIFMACMGLVFAAVYLGVFQLGLALSVLLAPTGLGDFAFDMIYGIWFMAGTMAAYIIRKPTAGFLAELFASVIELLFGNGGGIILMITGAIQGLGTELGFLLFGYKKWDVVSLSAAGILSAVLIYIFELFYLQYYLLPFYMHVAHLIIRSISAIVFSAVIVKVVSDGLARTAVLKNYPIHQSVDHAKVYEDE